MFIFVWFVLRRVLTQSAGAVEYTDSFSVEGFNPTPNECPVYDTKQSDGEFPVMLEFWGIQSTPSLPSLPDPLWPGVVSSDRVRSMGQIELNCVLMLNWIAWNRIVFDFEIAYLCETELFENKEFLTLKLNLR